MAIVNNIGKHKVRVNLKTFETGEFKAYFKPNLLSQTTVYHANRKDIPAAIYLLLSSLCENGYLSTRELRDWCNNFDETTEVIKHGYSGKIKG